MVLDGQDVGTKYPVLKTSIWKHVQELWPYHKGDVTHGMTAQLSVIGLIQSPDHLRKAEVKICRILRTKFDTYSARTEDFSLDTANKKTISSGQDVSYILINQMPNSTVAADTYHCGNFTEATIQWQHGQNGNNIDGTLLNWFTIRVGSALPLCMTLGFYMNRSVTFHWQLQLIIYILIVLTCKHNCWCEYDANYWSLWRCQMFFLEQVLLHPPSSSHPASTVAFDKAITGSTAWNQSQSGVHKCSLWGCSVGSGVKPCCDAPPLNADCACH